MKKIGLFLLLFVSVFAWSQPYYDAQWKKIQENYKLGKYSSNLPILKEIKNQAMKDNNTAQLVKALKGEFSIFSLTEDDTQNDAVSQYFSRLSEVEKGLSGDDLLLFQVLKTEFVQQFYQREQWEINQRTNIDNLDLSSIETWSKQDFKKYLGEQYAKLDTQKSRLKAIPLSKYKTIFAGEKLDEVYYPYLYDWYAKNYIAFLQNSNLFTPDEITVNRAKADAIVTDLANSSKGEAWLMNQLYKINYDCENAKCKDRLERLLALYNSEIGNDYKGKIAVEIMQEYSNKGDLPKAIEVAKQAKLKYKDTRFINEVINLENSITAPTLTINYEEQTQVAKPIHIVAETKNLSSFSLNIYEVPNDIDGFFKYSQDAYRNPFKSVKKTLLRKESYELTDPKDYKLHKTSLEIKPLPTGIYMIEYLVDNAVAGDFYFLVSNNKILYGDRSKDSGMQLRLVKNENGHTTNVKSVVAKTIQYSKAPITSTVAVSKEGTFVVPMNEESYYQDVLIQEAGTQNFNLFNVNRRNYYRSTEDIPRKWGQIFLDRAIYRPGQVVYFKVITRKIDGEKETVLANDSQTITLLDANGEEVSKQTFKTNEFGSYHGSFTLPSGKLNGQYSLQVNETNLDIYASFAVEEYKRPKFEVTFEPIKEEYKYGQTIEVKGKAMMFSGVPMSNAKVHYEIKKQNIRWRYFWWYPRVDELQNSILGEAVTNEKGEFTIKVKLEKDEKIEGIQIDNYQINASVTDLNGETQSSETSVKVASVSHYIKVNTINDASTDKEIKTKVATNNYNDQPLKKSYQVKLSKLKGEDRVLRSNFSRIVQDTPKLSKEEFIKLFPHDRYLENEKSVKNRIEKQIWEKKNQTAEELNLGKLDAGNYLLEVYNIEGKDTIKATQEFDVWDDRSLAKGQNPFLFVKTLTPEVERSGKAKFLIYSAIPKALVRIYIQDGKGGVRIDEKEVTSGVLPYSVDMPQDKSITFVNVQFQLASYNDVQTQEMNVTIKSETQPLKIETSTFRDKLQPGQKEHWSVKVTGGDKEKINAEVLANMYDMSLDQFAVNTYSWTNYMPSRVVDSYTVHSNLLRKYYSRNTKHLQTKPIYQPSFSWYDGGLGYTMLRSNKIAVDSSVAQVEEVVIMGRAAGTKIANYSAPAAPTAKAEAQDEAVADAAASTDVDKLKVPLRQNFNETAFFYPNLRTDEKGNVHFEFTSPEALTQWKVMFLAHTKDARGAVLEKEVVTQKEFSITPNYPRFLREGDEIQLQTKLSNITADALNGFAQLQILDAFTNEDITTKFGLSQLTQQTGYNFEQAFRLGGNASDMVFWNIKVPNNVSSVVFKVVAKGGKFSDGEQKAIAILPNRMLVTDALPIFVKEGQTKTFTLDALKNANSTTLSNVSNTLELTTNPIWEIMFALPSLKDDTSLSADVVFNKWFADVIASEIFRANPRMKQVFDEYQAKGLLVSNLEKNQELKQLLLEETPWVLDSKSETEQMQKLARIFDANTMRQSIHSDWEEVLQLQNPDGGFSWYRGYPSSYYNSLYILKNLGRLNQWLKSNVAQYQSESQKQMVSRLVQYVDDEVNTYYRSEKDHVWNNFVLDYLDTRQYWESEYPLKGKGAALKAAVIKKAPTADIKDFTFFGLHRAAMLFDQYGQKNVSKKLMTYLKETSVQSETQGVYWKQNLNDWGWYNVKTVNHAGALEAFQKLQPQDMNFIEEMKIWLITQKEVNSWDTSRSTAEVIYTILNSGKSWTTAESDKAEITWGGKQLQPQTQATGYVKQVVVSDQLNRDLSTVTVKKTGPGVVQGGVFWQYYEDLDKIKSSENYVSVVKELYKKIKTTNGEELQKITAATPLKIGDKVTVRMILNTDRNMEYVHIKDMRAAGFEPVDVMSSYQWKNNLGYYQSTKDASTNFYVEVMPKGKYVFEYDYICNAAGTFSNGITTLQNYYAPQMNSHTKGTKVTITP